MICCKNLHVKFYKSEKLIVLIFHGCKYKEKDLTNAVIFFTRNRKLIFTIKFDLFNNFSGNNVIQIWVIFFQITITFNHN